MPPPGIPTTRLRSAARVSGIGSRPTLAAPNGGTQRTAALMMRRSNSRVPRPPAWKSTAIRRPKPWKSSLSATAH